MGVFDNRVVLRLRRPKRDQKGKGVNIQLFTLPWAQICPVKVVREFLRVCPVGGGPLLVHEDGSFLSRFQFVSVFRMCLWASGLD